MPYHTRTPTKNGMMQKKMDLDVELDVVKTIQKIWDCTAKKLEVSNPFARIDYGLFDPKTKHLVAYLEIRRRYIPISRFKTIFLGEDKYNKMIEIAQKNGVPMYFLFVFDNNVWAYIDLAKNWNFDRKRASRGNMQYKRQTDTEWCVMIPVTNLTIIKEKANG